jgi:putative toxin-antitoxin system antitoxin component (TIGR02293 family)
MQAGAIEAIFHVDSPDRALSQIRELLGGRPISGIGTIDALSIHQALTEGLSSDALVQITEHTQLLSEDDVLEAVGVSRRTLQRRKGESGQPLSSHQSGRTWKFAEILARATELFGDQREAEKWLSSPATALDQKRPLDMLQSPIGIKLLEDLLTRMDYGVYT